MLNMWIPKDQNILAVCKNKKTSKRIAIAKSAMWQKIDKDMVLHQFDISEIIESGIHFIGYRLSKNKILPNIFI